MLRIYFLLAMHTSCIGSFWRLLDDPIPASEVKSLLISGEGGKVMAKLGSGVTSSALVTTCHQRWDGGEHDLDCLQRYYRDRVNGSRE